MGIILSWVDLVNKKMTWKNRGISECVGGIVVFDDMLKFNQKAIDQFLRKSQEDVKNV